MSDFNPSSVAYGLKYGEFDRLSPKTKKRLIRLMARLAEKSYRRGFQHGVEIGDERVVDPVEFRFQRSLDQSPYTDQHNAGHLSIDRLLMEVPELRYIGLYDGALPLSQDCDWIGVDLL